MRGKVIEIKKDPTTGQLFATLVTDSGIQYIFYQKQIIDEHNLTELGIGTLVDFSKVSLLGEMPLAEKVSIVELCVSCPESCEVFDYYKPGYYRHLDKERIQREHLKRNSGEYEVIEKLKRILYISHVNHHDVGHNCVFPFCLIGATEFLKQYIHGRYEFLLVFSHFDRQDWQQNTLKVAGMIRQRRKISERKPLVNFYVLISNAKSLKVEIDKQKGGTDAAVIPFSFEEILGCSSDKDLQKLFLSRFDEYIFENNMLGEENPIEQDTLLFGDRGKIADSIVQRCKEHKHSGIFGLRRSGKSSVLRAVMRRLDAEEIKYSTIEARSSLEPVNSWKSALYDIAREIRIATLGVIQYDNENRAQFNKRINLNSSEDDYVKRPTQCFVEDVKLYTKDEDVFVLAIDEIELITYNTATSSMWQDLDSYHNFWGALRDSGCSLILCGVNSTINEHSNIRYKGKQCDNPMYERIHLCANFSKAYLPAFTDEQTKIMINTLGGYSNIAFNNIYVDINRAFGGQPFPIRQFCSYAFERVKDQRVHGTVYEISKATFQALITDFNNSSKGINLYETILQHISIYRDEYEMLKKLAFAPDKYRKVEHKDIALIDHLEKYGLVEYDRTTFFVTFNIQSIQEYIKKTATKNPEDMNNDERRQYVQEKVAICERKLKSYILNYYKFTGNTQQGKTIIGSLIRPNRKVNPVPDPNTCSFDELFDHKKFIFFFSQIKKVIVDNWSTLGVNIDSNGITKERFKIYMDDLNAGRTDADHYDPEDMNAPDEWEIDDIVLQKFMIAYTEIKQFLDKYVP